MTQVNRQAFIENLELEAELLVTVLQMVTEAKDIFELREAYSDFVKTRLSEQTLRIQQFEGLE